MSESDGTKTRTGAGSAGAAARSPVIHVVDDESSIRALFERLGPQAGAEVRTYATAGAFLAAARDDRPGCLVLDVHLPDRNGIEVLRELSERDDRIPVIVISGMASVQHAVGALKLGGLDYVEKPFTSGEILPAIARAIDCDRQRRAAQGELRELRTRFARLTPRELEVMDLVVQGNANKVIASRLGVSAKTVEVHRANVMKKTEADSLAHLVRLTLAAGRT